MKAPQLLLVVLALLSSTVVASAQDAVGARPDDPPPLSSAPGAPGPDPVPDADGPDVDAAELELPEGIEIRGPDGPVGLGEWFEISVSGDGLSRDAQLVFDGHPTDVVAGKLRRESDGDRVTVLLSLCVARAGETAITDLVLKDGVERIALPPLELEVVFAMPDGHRPRVADLLAPVAVPLPPANVWAFALVAIVGLIVIGALVVQAGVVREVYVPPRPPDQVATEALERLRLALPGSPEEILAFIVSVSDVLRRYIEARFDLHAPARTTEEFLMEATSRHDEVSERRDTLEHFLTRCDLVKFAAQRPDRTETVALLDTAETFVEETR